MTTHTHQHRHSAASVAAKILSGVFSPLLSPTYAMVVALWLTPMAILPLGTRAWSVLGVFFITAVIPGLSILTMIRMGLASDIDLSDRRQRPIPFAITLLCYLGAAFYLGALNAPGWMSRFLYGASAVALVEGLISLKWKISAHAGGNAGLLAFVVWMASRNALLVDSFWIVSVSVAILGAVAWARLYLYRHSLAQVCAGTAVGFIMVFAAVSI